MVTGLVSVYFFLIAGISFLIVRTWKLKDKRSRTLLIIEMEILVLVLISAISFFLARTGRRVAEIEVALFICEEIGFLFVTFSFTSFFFTILHFHSERTTKILRWLLALVIVNSVALVFVPVLNRTFFRLYLWDCPSAPVGNFPKNGILQPFYLTSLGFMYILNGLLLLIRMCSVATVYRKKYFLILCSVLFASVFSILYFSRCLPFYFDYQIIFWPLISFTVYENIFRIHKHRMISVFRQVIFDRLGSPVLLFDDDGFLADLNLTAATLFSIDPADFSEVCLSSFFREQLNGQIRERRSSTIEEITLYMKDGSPKIYKLDYSCLQDKSFHHLGTLLVFHDITELKKMYNNMEHVAMTDQLTGLSSKYMLEKKITEINLYRKYPYCAAVCNINGQKIIIDGFGEMYGKLAVHHVADILRSQLRHSDFVASDFSDMVVLMPDTTDAEAEGVFRRIAAELKNDHTFPFNVTIEYGIANRSSADADMQETVDKAKSIMVGKKMLNSVSVHSDIVNSLQKALEATGYETEQHSQRVQDMAYKLGCFLKLPEDEIEKLRLLAAFHDIGKMSVSGGILQKKGELSNNEKDEIKMHTIRGCNIAKTVPELVPVADCILCHHEWWNGSGYPNGFKNEQIPYLSRIISIIDAYDAMTHDRPYRRAMTSKEAVEEIRKSSGKQFDPFLTEKFIEMSTDSFL